GSTGRMRAAAPGILCLLRAVDSDITIQTFMKPTHSGLCGIGVLFLASLSAGFAQSPQATIAGTVRDTQEAAVVGAEVAVVNAGTGARTAIHTNDSGYY